MLGIIGFDWFRNLGNANRHIVVIGIEDPSAQEREALRRLYVFASRIRDSEHFHGYSRDRFEPREYDGRPAAALRDM